MLGIKNAKCQFDLRFLTPLASQLQCFFTKPSQNGIYLSKTKSAGGKIRFSIILLFKIKMEPQGSIQQKAPNVYANSFGIYLEN